MAAENFAARLAQVKLENKNDIANFIRKTDFDKKLKNLNKNELNELSKEIKEMSRKILTKDLINKFSILNGAKYEYSGIFQNYLVFIPAKKYIRYFGDTTWIDSWKPNGMSEENIENITKSAIEKTKTAISYQLLLVIIYYQT